MSARTRVGRAFTSVYKRLGEKVGGCMATGWAVAAGDREAGSEQWYVIPMPLWPIGGTHKGSAYVVFL